MAAAIIPLIVTAISVIGPEIPAVVTLVERIFGAKSGPDKMTTAVSILTNILQTLANAGKIPSAPVVDPALPAGLAGAVQAVFDGLKTAGTLTPAATVTVPAASLAGPIAAAIQSVVMTKGGGVLVTG